jgi:ABC-type multidrug transport system fused ATPase/permease subunit
MGDQSSQRHNEWQRFLSALRITFHSLSYLALLMCVAALVLYHNKWARIELELPQVAKVWLALELTAIWVTENVGSIVRVASFALLAYALFKAAMNIERIFDIVNAFNTARSPIAQLQGSVQDVRTTADAFNRNLGSLQEASATLSKHAPAIAELNKKLDELSAQIFQLKVDTVSSQAEADTNPILPGTSQSSPNRSSIDHLAGREDQENWEELRAIWRRNIERLESLIKDRLKGARKRKYDDYSRTNYGSIIDKLHSDDALSSTARDKSKELHSLFMSYKPRNRPVTDDVVASMRILDRLLEVEIGSGTIPQRNPVHELQE